MASWPQPPQRQAADTGRLTQASQSVAGAFAGGPKDLLGGTPDDATGGGGMPRCLLHQLQSSQMTLCSEKPLLHEQTNVLEFCCCVRDVCTSHMLACPF